MADQPEALRLAEVLDAIGRDKLLFAATAAAAELRWLHDETQMLNSAYESACKIISEQDKKLAELEAVNRELLEALKLALSAHGVMLMSDPPQEAWKAYGVEQKALAAIAKAEGQK